MTSVPRYDLVLVDGTHLKWVAEDERPAPERIKFELPLRGLYRLPVLHHFLRQHWAKKHGARF